MHYRYIWKTFLSLIILLSFVTSCDESDTPLEDQDTFDREAMLINWADNIIVPGYQNYATTLEVLRSSNNQFQVSPNLENLNDLRNKWEEAYVAWQYVSMFEIGKAEELALRDFTNTYPTDFQQIEENITAGFPNFELPSSRDEQGFPALDYLLFGVSDTDENIVERYQNDGQYLEYLNTVVNRLVDLGLEVNQDWESYRDTFVANSGSSASASVNKLVNDYMFYYEKSLRAGKIGIPAGIFSNTPLSDKVETFFKDDVSKMLFETALNATIDFFNGSHFQSSSQGESLKSYLDYLETTSDGESLSSLINDQFQKALDSSEDLNASFYQQVETDNSAMLRTYDELQKNVVYLKVDMFQALNIQVDFVDADGD